MANINNLYQEVENILDHSESCKCLNDDTLVLEQSDNKVILVVDRALAKVKDYCKMLLWQLCKSGYDVVGNVYRYENCVDEYCSTDVARIPCILLSI